jgi:hypothetical protein
VSRNNHITVVTCQLFFIVTIALVVGCTPVNAQGLPSLWGSSSWFDWSDYRAEVGARVFLGKLVSGNVSWVKKINEVPVETINYDLTQDAIFGAGSDPEPFREFWAAFYLDRLGFRYHDEVRRLTRRDEFTNTRIWRIETSFSRIGLDLDLIRYPFLKFGIDADYNMEPARFLDATGVTTVNAQYTHFISYDPITLGVHARAIPVRIREVPLTVQARFRFPMPFVNRSSEARVTDWEIGGGIRPAIWEMSFIGLSSFSVGVEAGFRSSYVDFQDNKRDFQLKANWQGAFFRVGAYF